MTGELEQAVMEILWSRPVRLSVREVHELLSADRDLAYHRHDRARPVGEEGPGVEEIGGSCVALLPDEVQSRRGRVEFANCCPGSAWLSGRRCWPAPLHGGVLTIGRIPVRLLNTPVVSFQPMASYRKGWPGRRRRRGAVANLRRTGRRRG